MKKTLLFKSIALGLFMLFGMGMVNAQVPNAWINEIHYDNTGTDANEAIEIVVENPGSWDLTLLRVDLYNGSNGTTYNNATVDTYTSGEVSGAFTVYSKLISGIQNGAPDGMALSYNGTLIQFLSYEGTLTATDGPAIGITSTDIGVLEAGTEPLGESLQLSGTGSGYSSFTWQVPAIATMGAVNTNQVLAAAVIASDLFFSEYIEGSTNNRAIEIYNGTGADVDLSAYTVKQSYGGEGWGIRGGVAMIEYVLPLSGTLANGDVFIFYNADATDANIIAEGDLALSYDTGTQGSRVAAYTGNDPMGLFKNDVLIDAIGPELSTVGPWAVAGVAGATQDHTLVRKGTVIEGNTDWAAAAGTNADDSEWIVLAIDNTAFLGDHYFGEAPVETTYSITFNVDMSLVEGFDPNSDIVYIAGDLAGWAEPGSDPTLALTDTDGNMVYTIVLEIDIPGGDIAYKFFINAGWNTWGEWIGDPNRTATITEDTTLDHIFGNQGEPIFVGLPYIQNFDYTTPNASVALAGWTNANVEIGGVTNWVGKEFSSDKYVQMSSYGSTGADQVWLITPGITMINTTEELSFDVNVGFWTHDGLSVMISTDFDQTVAGIATATWTDVTSSFTIPSEPASGYGTFAGAGHLDVSAYTGNMYVAFVYNGNKLTPETTTYQIDNVVVAEAGTVGVDDLSSTEFSIYPNPSKGKFYIQTSSALNANTKVEVYNVIGMKVFETLANEFKTEIDLSSMKQGVYFVKVDDGANIITHKIIKQ